MSSSADQQQCTTDSGHNKHMLETKVSVDDVIAHSCDLQPVHSITTIRYSLYVGEITSGERHHRGVYIYRAYLCQTTAELALALSPCVKTTPKQIAALTQPFQFSLT